MKLQQKLHSSLTDQLFFITCKEIVSSLIQQKELPKIRKR